MHSGSFPIKGKNEKGKTAGRNVLSGDFLSIFVGGNRKVGNIFKTLFLLTL